MRPLLARLSKNHAAPDPGSYRPGRGSTVVVIDIDHQPDGDYIWYVDEWGHVATTRDCGDLVVAGAAPDGWTAEALRETEP